MLLELGETPDIGQEMEVIQNLWCLLVLKYKYF